MDIKIDKIIKDVGYLLKGYSEVKRKALQPFHYEQYIKLHPDCSLGRKNPIFHESLLEHVGMLPVLATYFSQYMDTKIDLGRVLLILSVHDIGELVVGDESTMTKNHSDSVAEVVAAKRLLHPSLHGAYMEYEELKTDEARYAKSIDKLAPDFYYLFTDLVLLQEREDDPNRVTLSSHIDMKMKKKFIHMQWSEFFSKFYPLLMQRYGVLLSTGSDASC